MNQKFITILKAMILPTIAMMVIFYAYYKYTNTSNSGLNTAEYNLEVFPGWIFIIISIIGYIGTTFIIYLVMNEAKFLKKK